MNYLLLMIQYVDTNYIVNLIGLFHKMMHLYIFIQDVQRYKRNYFFNLKEKCIKLENH